jgi:hypothetical protein
VRHEPLDLGQHRQGCCAPEMDARVKGGLGVWVVSGHGGGAGAGRPARRQRRLVTLISGSLSLVAK